MLLDLAGQLGGEIIHADPHQVGALAQCPGVTGVIAQILRNREAADQGGLQAWRSGVMLCLEHLQRGLYNRVAGAEIIDQ